MKSGIEFLQDVTDAVKRESLLTPPFRTHAAALVTNEFRANKAKVTLTCQPPFTFRPFRFIFPPEIADYVTVHRIMSGNVIVFEGPARGALFRRNVIPLKMEYPTISIAQRFLVEVYAEKDLSVYGVLEGVRVTDW